MSAITTENITEKIAESFLQRIRVEDDPSRARALEALRRLGMPAPKNEEYKYTPITRVLEKNFSFVPSDAPGPLTGIDEFRIPNLEDAITVFFIDGVYSLDHSTTEHGIPGVTIMPLDQALAEKHPAAIRHFGRYADINSDALTAWNTAAWTHGLLIHISENTVLEKPVVIYHLSNATAGEIIAVNRNLVVAGKNSEATIIERFDSRGSANHFSNLVAEVVVEEDARLNFASLQNDRGNRYQFGLTEFYQERSSLLNTYTFSLSGKLIRNNLHLRLDGENIESHMYGLYLLGKDTHADNHTTVDHMKPHSFSNELYKGIMDDNARGVFNGKIFVRPNAQKTNAFQANRNILLSEKATVNTKPQLEIWADDVKCSHGCTSGQLDEEAMFYLRSRGLSKDTAQAMMLYAFAAEVIEKVSNENLRKYLDREVSDRLHKNF